MSRDYVLRPNLSIKNILEYLNMSSFDQETPHLLLCDHVNHKDIDLRLKSDLFNVYDKNDATLVNDTLQITTNSTPVVVTPDQPIVNKIKYNGPQSLFSTNLLKPYTVHEIRDQGIDYYITEPGSLSVGASFDEDDFFGCREEIVNNRKCNISMDTINKHLPAGQGINDQHSPTPDDLPPYLDPDNDNFPEELNLAIQVHQAIIIEEKGKQSLSRVSRVESWLKENKSDLNLSDASINRIAAIISTDRIKRK